ncbi:hypothetical protein [Arthrobacter sp. 260]|uniref:hypothetical protein n=1 Tax=Arthrobacter sp. 260 TaxID=2735314 RepID=UPI00149318A1|nr:hypothetical protein [Arthrobacter sp. 260]NOJ59754.1 hypothetical protein [Arthrobacter sp. 260]
MAAPATLAGVEELADWLGEPIPNGTAESKRAVLCLRIASALVRKESGRTWTTDTGTLVADVPEDAVMVTLYCAGRVFDNRSAQTRGSIDDRDEAWRVDESGAYLTDSEKRMLSAFKATSLRGLGVVATTRIDTVPASQGWVPTGTPEVQFPWY